jgi:hypothetical protein
MLITIAAVLVVTIFWAMLVVRLLRSPLLVMRYNKYKPCDVCKQLLPPTGLIQESGVTMCYGCYGGALSTLILSEQIGEEKAREIRDKYMFARLLEALTLGRKVEQ